MGSVTWRMSDVVDGPPEAVWAWLTDFTKDDHATEAFRRGAGIQKDRSASSRTILSRDGDVLRIEDRDGRSTYVQTVTLHPEARRVHIAGAMGYDATWSATPEARGTRLAVQGRMGRGVLGAILSLFAGPIRRSMERDFRGHLEDLRETLRAAEAGRPARAGGEASRTEAMHGHSPP